MNSDQITTKIKKARSFWVATEGERKCALTAAKVMGIKYLTRSDERGGFHIIKTPTVKTK